MFVINKNVVLLKQLKGTYGVGRVIALINELMIFIFILCYDFKIKMKCLCLDKRHNMSFIQTQTFHFNLKS